MLKLSASPAAASKPGGVPFVQAITLSEGSMSIGMARWHTTSAAEGIVQLLDLYVEPAHQRQGHGGRLLKEAIAQASAHLGFQGAKLRRMWVAVEQKQQIAMRAFLTAQGFHHITTMTNLYREQDQLLYARSFD